MKKIPFEMKEFNFEEIQKFLQMEKSSNDRLLFTKEDEKIVTKIINREVLTPEEWEEAFFWSLPCFSLACINMKYEKNKIQTESEWNSNKHLTLGDIGKVKQLEILPLIDKQGEDGFETESGVAYWIKADQHRILFDMGLNENNEHPSPLLRNMKKLGVTVEEITHIVISHPHDDHTGGKWVKNDSFGLSGEQLDLSHVEAFTPVEMEHPSARITHIEKPKIIEPGIASIGSISETCFFMGLVHEQSLAINVEGKGIVLIVGCGHQGIKKIIDRTHQLFSIPIYGLIGGLHLPIPSFPGVEEDPLGLPFNSFVSGSLWNPMTDKDVQSAIDYLKNSNPKKVAISPHDSSKESIERFKQTFPDYIDLKVGKNIIISK